MRQLVTFLLSLTGPAKLCGLIALAGVVLSVHSWLSPQSSYRLSIAACVAGMVAAGVAFASVAGYNLMAFREKRPGDLRVKLPRAYWLAAATSFAYFLLVFVGTAVYYPQGVDLGPTVFFRVAAATMWFFGMWSLGFTQWAGLRARALRSAP